ncbi:BglG family transcription antiterminator [Anaerocolumna xylanovorans]|uniref:Transcriptional antiterminator n=1 Tax=Anaerocolumna xylanovorans DSM 12503 TaxID=1121345 RepID=A0A1M7YDG4_9FIRM|nr:PRD domain-containing protein [Anaerocolumna xylanovorans]SHO50616.1 Transcriptional antiterminator [Anaerocolumna xylanovorans DSM 12503]
MVELKSRSAYILKCAVENEKGISVMDILERLNITKRTFYYDLQKVIEWLEENDFGKVDIKSQVLRVYSDRMDDLRREMGKNTDYFFSIGERRTLEMLFITLSSAAVTIEKMQMFLDVSKNTILTDIRKWKEVLETEKLALISTIQAGYYITGEEFAVRKLISRQLQQLENLYPKTIVRDHLQKSLEELTGHDYDYKEIARCLIKQYVKDVDIKLVSEDIEYECMMIMVSWIRSIKGYVFYVNEDEKATLMVTGSYQSLKKSLENLKQYNMEIPENEVYYITTLLLGIKTIEFSSQEAENLFVYRFTALFIRNYERIACTSLTNRERLSNQLRCHIRPLYYRLKYGLQITNPLSEDVKNKYPETYEFTRRALNEITNELSVMITEEELAYLVIYFVSNRHDRNEIDTSFMEKPKILVVCGEGMATSMLIKEQLEEIMGDIFQYELKAASAIREAYLKQYVIIVSTVYIEALKERKNVFFTSAILTSAEKKEIVRYVGEEGALSKYEKVIQDILAVVEKDTIGKVDRDQLYFDLFQIFQGNNNKTRLIKSVKELIVSQAKDYSSWKEVVKEGCGKLAEGKEAEHLYERMLSVLNSKTMNMYEIRKNILLIHCPMQGIPHGRIEIGLIASREPLTFLNDMEGKLFLFLSTIDNYSHFKILKELYDYLDNEDGIRRMLN